MRDYELQGNRKYPWITWMTGEEFTLTRGEHFDVRVSSFISAGIAWSIRNGYQITTSVLDDDRVMIQMTGKRWKGRI